MTSNPQPKTYRIFRSSTFSPFRLKSRYVSIQESRAFRKASLIILTSQKARKCATFRYLFLFPRHQTDRFNVPRMRKLIKRPHFSQFISAIHQNPQIPCKRCRITTHINNPLRLHGKHRRQTLLIAALARRVYNNHIRMTHTGIQIVTVIKLRQYFLCFSHKNSAFVIPFNAALFFASSIA